MIFRNNNNRVSIINRLDFSNDREYYKHVRDFMNTKQSENLSHLREKKDWSAKLFISYVISCLEISCIFGFTSDNIVFKSLLLLDRIIVTFSNQ